MKETIIHREENCYRDFIITETEKEYHLYIRSYIADNKLNQAMGFDFQGDLKRLGIPAMQYFRGKKIKKTKEITLLKLLEEAKVLALNLYMNEEK
jgi:hypothetical protein